MEIGKTKYPYELHKAIMAILWPCDHTIAELRRKVDPLGRNRLKRQCAGCGKPLTNELKHAEAGTKPVALLPLWDAEAQQRYYSNFLPISSLVRVVINEHRKLDWWRQYKKYLDGNEWSSLRNLVFARSQCICEKCLVRPAIQVHHETYVRVGHERLEDLSAVCLECHRQLHPHMRKEDHV
jgi:hypothetical protein